jgi:putative Ca2+/H+ antiporter (TMEM165/GDT1 family)
MIAFLTSVLVILPAEFGDKTQVLAVLMASRFGKPATIAAALVLAAALHNTAIGFTGNWLAHSIDHQILRWGVGLLFIALAAWMLVPEGPAHMTSVATYPGGAFVAAFITFLVAEVGDKTELATAALAARFPDVVPVIAGATLGVLLANVPAVLLGYLAGDRLNMRYVRYGSAGVCALVGAATLLGVDF